MKSVASKRSLKTGLATEGPKTSPFLLPIRHNHTFSMQLESFALQVSIRLTKPSPPVMATGVRPGVEIRSPKF